MFQINEILTTPPFSLSKKEKLILFNEAMSSLTNHHYRHCSKYKSILEALKFDYNALLIGVISGFLSISLLVVNNLRDVKSDAISNKTTSPNSFEAIK